MVEELQVIAVALDDCPHPTISHANGEYSIDDTERHGTVVVLAGEARAGKVENSFDAFSDACAAALPGSFCSHVSAWIELCAPPFSTEPANSLSCLARDSSRKAVLLSASQRPIASLGVEGKSQRGCQPGLSRKDAP